MWAAVSLLAHLWAESLTQLSFPHLLCVYLIRLDGAEVLCQIVNATTMLLPRGVLQSHLNLSISVSSCTRRLFTCLSVLHHFSSSCFTFPPVFWFTGHSLNSPWPHIMLSPKSPSCSLLTQFCFSIKTVKVRLKTEYDNRRRLAW